MCRRGPQEEKEKEEHISSFRPQVVKGRVYLGSAMSVHLSVPLSMSMVIPLRKLPAVQPVEDE